jgi:hypothetical protein
LTWKLVIVTGNPEAGWSDPGYAGFFYGSLVWRMKTDLPIFLIN